MSIKSIIESIENVVDEECTIIITILNGDDGAIMGEVLKDSRRVTAETLWIKDGGSVEEVLNRMYDSIIMIPVLRDEVKACAAFLGLKVSNIDIKDYGVGGAWGHCEINGEEVELPKVLIGDNVRDEVLKVFMRFL